ncbi:MAG: MarR family EPS-associated transcriptional regulator [Candidatus Omnitrophica bacterium]|nr:MarR family EPS-associated transcriptional regulator [Candidatus Omnitrophota bacterium]MBD3269527.1 MarR family EPS-associated transcriptional regulator [Candidatus Omnitrophota bacterium]
MASPNQIHTREDVFNILRIVSGGRDLNQRQLSSELGFSLGKTNYLLKSLTRIGLIEFKNFSTKANKSKKVRYFLTKKGLKHKINLTYNYMKKKEAEYNRLREEWQQDKRS